MSIHRQNPGGSWSPAEPMPPSRQVRVENWLRRHRLGLVASLLARWDERGLGR